MTNNHKFHIAFEGIKGSGKSSLIELLEKNLRHAGIDFASYKPTAPAPAHLPVATAIQQFPGLCGVDEVQEALYAERAAWHSKQLKQTEASLILADRSIATSYATRWHRHSCKGDIISRVDALHADVPIPNVIVWLYCTPAMALQRIALRGKRSYGNVDERPERLREVFDAYEIIRKEPPPKLLQTEWKMVDATKPLHVLARELFNFITNAMEWTARAELFEESQLSNTSKQLKLLL